VSEFGVSFTGCAVVSHEHHIQAYTSGATISCANPQSADQRGENSPFNEEGGCISPSLCWLSASEIINGEYGKAALCSALHRLCQSHKLAGGSIVSMREPQIFNTPDDEKKCVRSSGV
jgi:CRISPR-associated protein Csy2